MQALFLELMQKEEQRQRHVEEVQLGKLCRANPRRFGVRMVRGYDCIPYTQIQYAEMWLEVSSQYIFISRTDLGPMYAMLMHDF